MHWNVLFKIAAICTFLILLASCQSEYDKVVKQELSTGVIHTDLIFDLEMGMTKKDYFASCWKLNSEKKVNQGPTNQFVQYNMPPGEIKGEEEVIIMLFYGIFDDEDIMRGLNCRFNYSSWAPWNDLQSGKLVETLKSHYMEKYDGNPFIQIDLKNTDIKAFVKVDGNRQILIYPLDAKDVAVKIEDLRYKYDMS